MAQFLELSLIILVVLSTAYLLLGWYGYRTILQANPCNMTYSAKASYPVVMESSGWKYQLRKVSNAQSHKLNSQPVLFIPGHQGSHNQARSFASEMHNSDQFFQYFSLDFNGEPIAFHGGDIMDKAVFVNEALKFINEMYEKQGQIGGVKHVVLLGHSYGGMIARTAVLLTNHPKCLVQNIIMLSAPNTRPPIGPDGSLDMLFHNVNKAWYNAQFNSSCQDFAVSTSKKVALNVHCPNKCTKHVRILSISGGEVDVLVPTELTNVFEMSARPRNTTTLPSKNDRVYTLSKYFQVKDILKAQFSKLTYVVVRLFGSKGNETVSTMNNTTDATGNGESCSADDATCKLKEEVEEPSINPNSTYAFITRENWNEFIIPYQDPQHISLRTSQLIGVGFPIDHYAILWCHQLIDVVQAAMRKLSKSTKSITSGSLSTIALKPVVWEKMIPFKSSISVTETVAEVKPLNISNLSSFAGRNVSDGLFQSSRTEDLEFIQRKLSGNEIWIAAYYFFRTNLSKVFISAVIIIIFALAGKYFQKLSGKKDNSDKASVTAMLGMEGYESFISNLLIRFEVRSHEVLLVTSVFIVCIIAYAKLYGKEGFNTVVQMLEWIPCVGVALAVIIICHIIIVILRRIFSLIWTPVAKLKKWFKRTFRKTKKSMYNYILQNSFLQILFLSWTFVYSNAMEFMVLALFFTLLLLSRKTNSAAIGTSNTIFAVGALTFYASFVSVLLYLILFPLKVKKSKAGVEDDDMADDDDYEAGSNNKKKQDYVSMETIVLFFFMAITGFSSALFSFKLLFTSQPSHLDQSELYSAFGPERMNYCLAVFFAFLYLRQVMKYGSDSYTVTPIKYLTNSTGKVRSGAVGAKAGKCFHEDGGSNAVFEPLEYTDEVQLICGDKIVMGPTYKVVSCDCAKNKALKTFDEWCEYCRCEQCGGKNIVFGSNGRPATGPEFTLHIDLVLWVLLLLLVYYLLVKHDHQIYKTLLCTGILSAVFYVRGFFSKSELTFKP